MTAGLEGEHIRLKNAKASNTQRHKLQMNLGTSLDGERTLTVVTISVQDAE